MFRPMRRIKQEIPHEDCVKILSGEKRAVLSVIGDDGYPYGVPINFYYDADTDKVYFHCAKAGHKLDSLLADDKVCLTVYDNGYRKEDFVITSNYAQDHPHPDYAADDSTFAPLW